MRMRTPIYDAIKSYIRTKPVPFHMPGHRMGSGIPRAFQRVFPACDLTEIPGLDNLHCPEGVVMEAQQLAAKAFGAARTYFLVNGSSCGLQAALMSLCKPGDKALIGRDCHKSVITGLILADADPVYIIPGYNDRFCITTGIDAGSVKKSLDEHPDAACVVVTRPNYYGVCTDISSIADVVHSYGKILCVDEAHGAHLAFNRKLPICALEGGADIVIQSAHKTLPAPTQSALLHVGSAQAGIDSGAARGIDIPKLENALRMLQTSSPSYILMMYLDAARAVMERDGEALLEQLLHNIGGITNIHNIEWLGRNDIGAGRKYDPSRMVMHAAAAGLDGFTTTYALKHRFGIQTEMADLFNVVILSAVSNTKKDFARLRRALTYISDNRDNHGLLPQNKAPADFDKLRECSDRFFRQPLPRAALRLKEAFHMPGESIGFRRAAGRISRGMIVPYPPGIPAVMPGEEISAQTVEYIGLILDAGGAVEGLKKINDAYYVDVMI